jgi:hypothetical protein
VRRLTSPGGSGGGAGGTSAMVPLQKRYRLRSQQQKRNEAWPLLQTSNCRVTPDLCLDRVGPDASSVSRDSFGPDSMHLPNQKSLEVTVHPGLNREVL